jgi:hypothetical protein
MIAGEVLLAAVGDWVTWIVVAVVIVVSFLNQLLTDAAKKKPPQMPRRPGGGANPGGGQKSLLDEVEKFLQEARNQTSQSHQRPPQQQPQEQPRPQQQMSRSLPSQQRPPQQQQSKKKQRREQQRREQPQPQRLATSERSRLRPDDDSHQESRGGDLSRLSGQHLQTSRFDERAERLSHLQQTVDSDIAGHVQQAFDHQIGSLHSAPSTAATAGASTDALNPALQLIALLSDPNGIRNAVLMREILEPPTHRW